MANTYTNLAIHVTFRVRRSSEVLPISACVRIEKIITGIVKKHGQKLLAVACLPDHVHIMVGLRPNIALSDLIRDVKSATSKIINEQKITRWKFQWQDGFGAFSCSKDHEKNAISYILHQWEHHLKLSFEKEYLGFLKEHEIEFDTNYAIDADYEESPPG